MRVIAGVAKGHKLISPKGLGTRPTSDRAKESIFNIIADKIPEAKVLDLFAGSGAFGIEALSRGAQTAVFVENNQIAIDIIYKNLAKTSLDKRAVVLKKSAHNFFVNYTDKNGQYDLIFFDPPYKINYGVLDSLLKELVARRVLSDNGLVILEHSSKVSPVAIEVNLNLKFTRIYGDTSVSFFELV
ncbi:MAG TPA: 16S rRNA (guanine(966)-N(2))-methyltransferase RsmD [Actinobacteria bacterium]|nr:16S rRNA (guanine(966)-N(2))-methyltransferase RsmD [Actinomycetota bacterium]